MLCTSSGKEVVTVDSIFKIILSVVASVISYFICKWLDRER